MTVFFSRDFFVFIVMMVVLMVMMVMMVIGWLAFGEYVFCPCAGASCIERIGGGTPAGIAPSAGVHPAA